MTLEQAIENYRAAHKAWLAHAQKKAELERQLKNLCDLDSHVSQHYERARRNLLAAATEKED